MTLDFFDIIVLFSILTLIVLLFNEFKRDLMLFQQNSYRPERYKKWLRESGDTTSLYRIIGMCLVLFSLSGFKMQGFAAICISFYAIVGNVILLVRKYKKPLVVTARIKRLSWTLLLITILISVAAIFASFYGLFGLILPFYTITVVLLLIYCSSHFFVLLSYYFTKPIEKSINRKYYISAQKKLKALPDLRIIGITGSYGKTSTKHYLHRILSEEYETLMTPGSFNTTLGVVRTINENLKPFHQAFIVEMGAKQKGDIKEICDLVHPSVGIITAVGPQHLETFQTIDNVRDTKFELVDSLPKNGTAVLNNDFAEIEHRNVDNCNVIRYSCKEQNDAAFIAHDIKYHQNGTNFLLKCPDGHSIPFETQLLGKHNIANLTGAIAVAITLNVPEDKIKYSVSHIEPVEHRLSIRRVGNGLTILDDAFNSNPMGAAMAIEVLSAMDSGKRIVITPGMIELGSEQYNLNFQLGKKIAEEKIDFVAVVGNYNKKAITEGLISGGQNETTILHFEKFIDANNWMIAFTSPGDVVLIENDLPDTYK